MRRVKFIFRNLLNIPQMMIKGITNSKQNREDCCFSFYEQQFKRYIHENQFNDKELPGEAEYVKKWSQLDHRVEPYSFRFYSNYMTNPLLIIPEAIGHLRIEECINNQNHVEFYSDKNCYDIYLQDIHRPRTLLRRCGDNFLLDASYNIISDITHTTSIGCLIKEEGIKEAIFKPSIDSDSGVGVIKLIKNTDGDWIKPDGNGFTVSDMSKYKHFIIQECIQQSSYISRFCKTAVNTMRICMYKSVVTGEWKMTASVLRIAKDGKCVDNAHAGGITVRIEPDNGRLGNHLYDSHGRKLYQWNGIDFSKSEHTIPNWNKVKEFAYRIAMKYVGFRLIAFDICLDKDDMPVLIETNVKGFAYWLPQLFDFDVFDGEHEQLIKYCKDK